MILGIEVPTSDLNWGTLSSGAVNLMKCVETGQFVAVKAVDLVERTALLEGSTLVSFDS